ncbi:uncharacterized protein ACA1_093180 [Acanthamoeba castellanii str. Neff]|uniref:Uncharacterized protein n=1 Tax=Acanthamoeba castellanii (strain ATCC 30010 / Neff) TaxID=1257118 RepID=L8GIG6_ACACF|nr:uncharacterized protein ACA1_093180 [Acanthamoeba castellanii str. Neff]ELR12782.1 hypothetical protein ACA1_093180 [Acanthamoeba castellanii str. Neff]
MGGSRSSPVFAFALLYFAFILSAAANGISPTSPFANAPPLMVKDVPFEQTTSKIFVFASSASASNNPNRDEIEITSAANAKINFNLPTGWDRLPFDAAFQVVSRPTGTDPASSFLILTKTHGAWTLDLPARGGVDGKASFKRVDAQLGLKVDATMRVTFHPTSIAKFAAASASGVFRCSLDGERCRFVAFNFGAVNAVEFATTSNDALWVGSERGLFFVSTLDGITYVNSTEGEGVVSLAVDHSNAAVWAGTQHKLVPAVVDAVPVSLTLDNEGRLWVPNDESITVIAPDLTATRVRGGDGLPVVNLTASALSPRSGAVWFGSKMGLLRHQAQAQGADPQDPAWRYFFGARWLPGQTFDQGQRVVSLAVSREAVGVDETAVVVTDGGLAVVRQETGWTLRRKADHYQAMVKPRHDRLGYADENSGLWTSMYLASQAFRYADPEVKREAWKNFEAMEFLYNVTGIRGLMARTVAQQNTLPKANWHFSSAYPGWVWQGDTSSDEVTGHMFVYPLVHDLLAETPSEKARALRLVNDTMSYIVDNGLYLIDVTGKPTRWGKWSPEYLNHNLTWTDQNGLNSLQIVSWLLSAYRLTGDPKFQHEINKLVEKHQYGINIINTKDVHPGDDNYSDDPVRSSLWNVVYLSASTFLSSSSLSSVDNMGSPESDTMGAAAWTLRRWPLSLVHWPVRNSQRLDLIWTEQANRFAGTDYRPPVLPWDEGALLLWNADPFEPDGGSGHSEQAPTPFLLPYWLARYYGLLSDAAQ